MKKTGFRRKRNTGRETRPLQWIFNDHRSAEPGGPNGVTIISGLPVSNCQRALPAKKRKRQAASSLILLVMRRSNEPGDTQWRNDSHRPIRPELPAAFSRQRILTGLSSNCHEFPLGTNSIFISKKAKFLFTFTPPYDKMYLVKIGNYPNFLRKNRIFPVYLQVIFTIFNFFLVLTDCNVKTFPSV